MGDAQLVMGALGYFIVVGFLLGISGLTATTIELPTSPGEETSESGNKQGVVTAGLECGLDILSLGFIGKNGDIDCNRKEQSKLFTTIGDVFVFAKSSTVFLFQLLTLQIPEIPVWMSAVIVLPPAAALAFVGLRFIRGVGG